MPPAGNRDPLPEETAACSPFLERQIAIVDPLLIVTLGRFSMSRWFPGASISRIHGQPKRFGGRTVLPMYHPAAALHRGDLRPVIEADFGRIPELLEQARSEGRAGNGSVSEPSTPYVPASAAAAPRPSSEQRSLL